MNVRLLCRWIFLVVVFAARTSTAQQPPPEQIEESIRQVQQSHIDGNVPSQEDFDRFLKRDLGMYFGAAEHPDLAVEYELLRDGPTQTGIAYPKYYVWVRVFDRGSFVREGAARLAAIERKRFEVTHFLDLSQIEEDPSQLEMLFPAPVAAGIRARLHSDKTAGDAP